MTLRSFAGGQGFPRPTLSFMTVEDMPSEVWLTPPVREPVTTEGPPVGGIRSDQRDWEGIGAREDEKNSPTSSVLASADTPTRVSREWLAVNTEWVIDCITGWLAAG
jgi:hypothetical protein